MPRLGRMPQYQSFPEARAVILPIWLPLSVVLGLIVFRELRWGALDRDSYPGSVKAKGKKNKP